MGDLEEFKQLVPQAGIRLKIKAIIRKVCFCFLTHTNYIHISIHGQSSAKSAGMCSQQEEPTLLSGTMSVCAC